MKQEKHCARTTNIKALVPVLCNNRASKTSLHNVHAEIVYIFSRTSVTSLALVHTLPFHALLPHFHALAHSSAGHPRSLLIAYSILFYPSLFALHHCDYLASRSLSSMTVCIIKAGNCRHKIRQKSDKHFVLKRESFRNDVPYCNDCLETKKQEQQKQIEDALAALTAFQALNLEQAVAANDGDEDSLFVKDDDNAGRSQQAGQATITRLDQAIVAAVTSMQANLSAVPADLRSLRLPMTLPDPVHSAAPTANITVEDLTAQLARTVVSSPSPPSVLPARPSAPGPVRHERQHIVGQYAGTTASMPYPSQEAAAATMQDRHTSRARTTRVASSTPNARSYFLRPRPQHRTTGPSGQPTTQDDSVDGMIQVGGRQVARGWFNFIHMRMSETGETNWAREDERQKIMIEELMRREGYL
jgi:hypothetical protein